MAKQKTSSSTSELMLVNSASGEECRIAILQDGHLEELYSERVASATNVGNIYKGRVTNVEAAIQAAFVDYGQARAGFLHISDLHPRYFPGSKRTERVGRKIPRRDRPLIQDALKRGDEVLVQVLKEGIGTKGPTLTSYLSIPGRLVVMMPEMDRVGVSRKVEDPEKRREMREILDSVKLPEGFGFILRTAGFEKGKTELTRDVAYLTRLWKVMDKRIKTVATPCELYGETDLLIRTIRDVLRPSIDAIVVDCESAHERASAFLRVVAPRSAPKIIRYRGAAPIFHAFDVERQIEMIHSREVPLPSGGKLVIEQTEALVAIDVNSGRSRSARDSETNAYRTNCEAAEEICRQLRLRDLGGLVINDLIDMHMARHRRDIEERFRQCLKRDRAKAMVLPISEFGILEMTRQRMRPSLRKSHYMPCTQCDGHGETKTPESVGADAMREVGFLLQFERVKRVELVCSPRVASVLLSSRRRELVALEDGVQKKIEVRVSDAIAVDRVDYYAYDERNVDIDISKLPALKPPTVAQLELDDRTSAAEAKTKDQTATTSTKKRRRRRSASAPASAEPTAIQPEDLEPDEAQTKPDESTTEGTSEDTAGSKKKRRRRRRRSKVREEGSEDGAIRVHELANELNVRSREVLTRCGADDVPDITNHMSSMTSGAADQIRAWFARESSVGTVDGQAATSENGQTPGPGGTKKKSRRRRSKKRGQLTAEAPPAAPIAEEAPPDGATDNAQAAATGGATKKSRRRRRRSKPADEPISVATSAAVDPPSPPRRKTLYRSRVSVSKVVREEAPRTIDE
ncbi:MAG: Rne/Rng family ribonuclease [Planctomycetes bacterium]|nr:Rne/Rng family ribonuclease [Planctomycetota bacterium]